MIKSVCKYDAMETFLVHEYIFDTGWFLLSLPYSHEIRGIRKIKLIELRFFLELPSIYFVAICHNYFTLLSRNNFLDSLCFRNTHKLERSEREEFCFRSNLLVKPYLVGIIWVFEISSIFLLLRILLIIFR